MPPTNAAHEAYDRLIAARREVTPLEQEEIKREAEREQLALKIRRRMPKVY